MGKRIAVVTGGIGGLGTEICRALAQAGRTVIAVDLESRQERIAAFAQEVQGLDIRFAAANVADYDRCGELVRSIEEEHGALDILVNNAGIIAPIGHLEHLTSDSLLPAFEVNVIGLHRMTVACLPLLKQSQGQQEQVVAKLLDLSCYTGTS